MRREIAPQIDRMLTRAHKEFPGVRVAIHVHDTRNMGLANAYAAVPAGADVLDASTVGRADVPLRPKATGNIPIDDLVFMPEGMEIKIGL